MHPGGGTSVAKQLQVLALERSDRDDVIASRLGGAPRMRVVRVFTILDALRRLETSHDIDAVVVHVDLECTERIEKLQSGYPHVPIVVVATDGSDELVTRAMGLGAQDVVQVDEREGALVRSVQYAVERVKATRSLRTLSPPPDSTA